MRFRAIWEPSFTYAENGAFVLVSEREAAKVAEFFAGKSEPPLAILQLDVTRSDKDHGHYFACIQAAYDSLPEDMGGDFKSAEHLRKWALVKAGYCTTAVTVCKSKAEAHRMAAFAGQLDGFCVATIDGRVVTVSRAQSQSYDDMSKSTFKASKTAVLEVLSLLLGTSVEELLRSIPRE